MGRSWVREQELEVEFKKWKKKHCATCRNKVYCLINEEDNEKSRVKYHRQKEIITFLKGETKHDKKFIVSCKNFKPLYLGKYLLNI